VDEDQHRVRVLHLYSGNLYGGVERLLVTLARERAQAPEMQPAFGLCFDGRLAEELRKANAPVRLLGEVRFRRPWTVLKARRGLSELLSRERVDVCVCHSTWPHAIFAPVVRRARLPLAFWAHDVPRGTPLIERLARRTPPDLAIANSRFTLSAMPHLFHAPLTGVVYPPVAPPKLDRAEAWQRVRQELGTASGEVVIAMTTRLEPMKGHVPLLDALAHLTALAGWECWIAGGAQRPKEQRYLNELRRLIASRGLSSRVKLLGQRDDVPRLLAAADVYAQPNLEPEGFGISFVEAMHASLPVVTSAIGSAPEVIGEADRDGTARCGVLTPPGDVTALAAALRRLINDGDARTRLGIAGPARARELSAPATTLTKLDSLLAPLGRATPVPPVAAEHALAARAAGH
jgi:glycosyltransferase involved in cell wall biosynthesis